VEINGREEEESLGGRRGSHIFYPFKLWIELLGSPITDL
jgi:hypothetical protein